MLGGEEKGRDATVHDGEEKGRDAIVHDDECSVSRWRPQKVDKRMVLEYTHGLFIT